jgi:hypothetical protein
MLKEENVDKFIFIMSGYAKITIRTKAILPY